MGFATPRFDKKANKKNIRKITIMMYLILNVAATNKTDNSINEIDLGSHDYCDT